MHTSLMFSDVLGNPCERARTKAVMAHVLRIAIPGVSSSLGMLIGTTVSHMSGIPSEPDNPHPNRGSLALLRVSVRSLGTCKLSHHNCTMTTHPPKVTPRSQPVA